MDETIGVYKNAESALSIQVAAMSRHLKTLSMDSAAQVGSVALLVGPHRLAQHHFHGPAGHAVLLPERVAHLLAQESLSCADLDLIVITIGPGAFAGLRIALGYAKGMALVHGTPVVGISNLDLLAAGVRRQEGWVSVVVDARRGEVFAALYRLEKGILRKHTAPNKALPPATWATMLSTIPEVQRDSLCLTGTGLGLYGEVFQQILTMPFDVTPESDWIADPVLLGLLGQQQFLQMPSTFHGSQNPISPDLTLLLDYQRRPDAEEKTYGTPCISAP